MIAVREFPPNPHALVFHTDALITDQVVESYTPDSSDVPHEWARRVLALPGVRALSLNAYKIRLQKHRDARWQPILGPAESILREQLGLDCIGEMVETEAPRRVFCWHGAPLPRRVFEGKRQAAKHPLAAALFGIHGVAEVILDDHRVEVRKCPLCSWSEMAPQIERALRDAR